LGLERITGVGVFMQHGDRKSEQQRLYCGAPVDLAAGELSLDGAGPERVLLERPGASACPTSAVTIADTGATFGSAGRTSAESTAKMNLDAWRHMRVFREPAAGECIGELTVSLKARRDGDANPPISEAGRRFFLEQLHRLTPAHVKAIFTAAHVDQLPGGSLDSAREIDAWVAAFEDKVRQIEDRRCQAAN
jgi:hypothetical protein